MRVSIEKSIELYKKAFSDFYKPFLMDHGYILENYLVNYLFKNTFPYNITKLFEQYIMLVIHFVLIKLHLIGMSSHYQMLSTELTVKLIQSLSKAFEHNSNYLDDVQNELHDKQYTTMAHMIVLLKIKC